VVLCCESCIIFQIVYKENCNFVPEDRPQDFAWWLLCLEPLWT
jgi:hypothetical protein